MGDCFVPFVLCVPGCGRNMGKRAVPKIGRTGVAYFLRKKLVELRARDLSRTSGFLAWPVFWAPNWLQKRGLSQWGSISVKLVSCPGSGPGFGAHSRFLSFLVLNQDLFSFSRGPVLNRGISTCIFCLQGKQVIALAPRCDSWMSAW